MAKNAPENPELKGLIKSLEAPKSSPIYKAVAYELGKPKRKRVSVNLGKLSVLAKDGDTVLVPGKVLSSGSMKKKVTVAAFSFSAVAKEMITKAGGKAMSISELVVANPKGTGVCIIK
ncbi:MAG: 50S ribosomal protein L18e [Candidatus Micrarchaeia archaeon]